MITYATTNMRQMRPLLHTMASFLRRHRAPGNSSASLGMIVVADPTPHPGTGRTPFSRRFSSSSHTTGNPAPSFRWLDLQGAGLSMVERLTLEEALLKNTQDNWIIVGRHAVWPPKYISIPHIDEVPNAHQKRKNFHHKVLPDYMKGRPNPNGMIVMGIGGKAEKLLNSQKVIDDELLVVKRFSGGGTVVMDENAIWTTLIAGRRRTSQHEETETSSGQKEMLLCKPYPRDIMKWTAEAVFGPTFNILNASQKRQNTMTDKINLPLPKFSLQEDDYVLTLDTTGETRKMGGNAQAITGKQGWLHHTSFLWDYEDFNMECYLKLPEKRPDYRVDRSHKDFLVKLHEHYGCGGESQNKTGSSVFCEAMKQACIESLGDVRETDWPAVYQQVFDGSDTSMNAWWLENRTRIQHEL